MVACDLAYPVAQEKPLIYPFPSIFLVTKGGTLSFLTHSPTRQEGPESSGDSLGVAGRQEQLALRTASALVGSTAVPKHFRLCDPTQQLRIPSQFRGQKFKIKVWARPRSL